jgi:predicted O-methyltransferase YrrM
MTGHISRTAAALRVHGEACVNLLSLADGNNTRLRRHSNPRYVWDRARQLLHERAHPEDPWITPEAVRLLESMLRPTDRGVEFGSGRSTLWFAKRVAHLTSVEEDPAWHRSVAARLAAGGCTNVEQILAPVDVPLDLGESSAYVAALHRFPECSLDFALVDGAYRAHATKLVMPRLRPGGVMVLDNAGWYLPSSSRAPGSRSMAAGPEPLWLDIVPALADWRQIWTSSGVWDTAIFIRP